MAHNAILRQHRFAVVDLAGDTIASTRDRMTAFVNPTPGSTVER
jgi:hypothetical protein